MDRQWCKKHGKSLPPPKLPKVVLVSIVVFKHTIFNAAATLSNCTSASAMWSASGLHQACIFSIIFTSPLLRSCMQRVIKEWFQLVDDDGSGTLEHHELLAALQVSPTAGTH